MTTTPPKIDLRLGAAALRAPAASREDSHPQAILKVQACNSFYYRVFYVPQQRLNLLRDVAKGCVQQLKDKKRLLVFSTLLVLIWV